MSRRRSKRDRPDFSVLQRFVVECPGCRVHVGVATSLAGRAARCPACDLTFLVPTPEPEEPSLPDSSAERSRSRRKAASSLPAFEEPLAAPPPKPVVATPRPDAEARTIDPPLVFAEPPPPSTRRTAGESPTTPPGTDIPEITTPPVTTADAGADSTVVSSPEASPAGDASQRFADQSDPDGLAFRDPVRTVRSGDTEIELRRLSPDEKRTRRARRNLLILVVGAALLVGLAVILGTGRR